MKNGYRFPEQNVEHDCGDIELNVRRSSPRDNAFSPKKHPMYLILDFCAAKKTNKERIIFLTFVVNLTFCIFAYLRSTQVHKHLILLKKM